MSLLVCNIVTIACVVLLFGELLGFTLYYLFGAKTRKEKVEFIRSFKNGKFAFVYIIAAPLYFIGHMYGGMNFGDSFFTTIDKIIGLVVLGFDPESLEALMRDSECYFVTIYITYSFVFLNVVMFAVSVFRERFLNALHKLKMRYGRKPQLYLFGNNKENVSIYRSETKRRGEIVDMLDKEQCSSLYLDKCNYRDVESFESALDFVFKGVSKKRKTVLVVNTKDDKTNLEISYQAIKILNDLIKKYDDRQKEKQEAKKKKEEKKGKTEENKEVNKEEKVEKRYEEFFDLYVFGNPAYESGYLDAVGKGHGCVHYVNKYKIVAERQVENHPYAYYMNGNHIDYETSLVKPGVEINSLFIGFGKANRQMFLTSVANNQFLHLDNGVIKLKKVNYYIFDKQIARANKNLNHSYYRFRNELTMEYKKSCLPMPEIPANEEYEVLDVNSPEFYVDIKRVLTRSKNDVNFINIGFGNDLENMDMAQKLVSKIHEWGLENVKIFVRIRGWDAASTFLDEKYCIAVGDEKKYIYNIDCVINDSLAEMSIDRNTVYDIAYEGVKQEPEEREAQKKRIEKKARSNWFTMHENKRESSRFAVLSLRSKLNMMGLDYAPNKDGEGLTEEQYMEIYAKDDMPNFTNIVIDNKRVIEYTVDFKESRRRTMAIQEHERWNSFMISRGFIPATKQQIFAEFTVNEKKEKSYTSGKDFNLRRHGNITTFDGLVEFREMTAVRVALDKVKKKVKKEGFGFLRDPAWFMEKFGDTVEKVKTEQVEYTKQLDNEAAQFLERNGIEVKMIDSDVIKYDYQLLDDAHWLLKKNGYMIVKK